VTLPARARWAPIALAVVVADQLTKWWAVERLSGHRTIDVFWTLRFNLTYNTGMSFGQGRGLGPIIGVVALVVIVALLLGLQRGTSALGTVAVGAIIGGALGNLIDRTFREPYWFRGGVVDFIDFQWFPIFNVADMGITVGGAALLLSAWRAGAASERHREPTAAAARSTAEGD
jgi:signal peptidase II